MRIIYRASLKYNICNINIYNIILLVTSSLYSKPFYSKTISHHIIYSLSLESGTVAELI